MEDTEWPLPYGVLPSSLVSVMGIGIGGSHHHITGASPEDDTQAEGSQDLFLQMGLRVLLPSPVNVLRTCRNVCRVWYVCMYRGSSTEVEARNYTTIPGNMGVVAHSTNVVVVVVVVVVAQYQATQRPSSQTSSHER